MNRKSEGATTKTRDEIRVWAEGYSRRLCRGAGRGGVVIGGSIARGQHWEHSDLELGVLVDAPNPALPYFNVDSERGVEVIQLEREQLSGQLERVEAGDVDPVAEWPVQLWRCRVVHDPDGIFSRFKRQFDAQLFLPTVSVLKRRQHTALFEQELNKAREAVAASRPRMGRAWARSAVNEGLLALHWRFGELPRSQNRSASRLRNLAARHHVDDFYQLYAETFSLDSTSRAIAEDWPHCKEQVLELTELLEGENSRAFFSVAVDSNFEWGVHDGILCVYRLYVPLLGTPGKGILELLDDHQWQRENEHLLKFLGLDVVDVPTTSDLLDRLAGATELFA